MWAARQTQGEIVTWKPGNGYFGLCSFFWDNDEVFHKKPDLGAWRLFFLPITCWK